jgi:23S rRNA pseudouridine955/2504/2580 synthase
MQHQPTTFVTIDSLSADQRIDNFLLRQLKGFPKSHIYRIIRKGEVRVNKGRIKPCYRLQVGDVVRIPPAQVATKGECVPPSKNVLDVLANSVLYQDNSLLVINKPTGLAVHGGSGIGYGVIEGLRALYPAAPYLELVHRLDRETSGCLMIAKKPALLRQLHQLLRDNQLHKRYLALVKGQWPTRLTTINAPLQKNICQSGERVVKVDAQGKPARSHFTLKQAFSQTNPCVSLIEVELETGRTHQIRVHTAFAQHPIAGDGKYGDEAFNTQMKNHGLQRLFLHAASIRLNINDKPLTIEAPLPMELTPVLKRLA